MGPQHPQTSPQRSSDPSPEPNPAEGGTDRRAAGTEDALAQQSAARLEVFALGWG